MSLTVGSLCTGYGGLELGLAEVVDVDVRWHCEISAEAGAVLDARYSRVPNHGDIAAVGWSVVESVDVLSAGFPCQPVSLAGRRKVTEDDRWLWPDVADAIRILRPRAVVLENVTGLLAPSDRYPAPAGGVLGDLAALGFDAGWCCIRASEIGAPHDRDRIFIVATDAGGA